MRQVQRIAAQGGVIRTNAESNKVVAKLKSRHRIRARLLPADPRGDVMTELSELSAIDELVERVQGRGIANDATEGELTSDLTRCEHALANLKATKKRVMPAAFNTASRDQLMDRLEEAIYDLTLNIQAIERDGRDHIELH